MDPKLKWSLQITGTVVGLVSLLATGRRRGWI
jgi:hypothetical protein